MNSTTNPLADFKFWNITDVRKELISYKEKFDDEKFNLEFVEYVFSKIDQFLANKELKEKFLGFRKIIYQVGDNNSPFIKFFVDMLNVPESNNYGIFYYYIFFIEAIYFSKTGVFSFFQLLLRDLIEEQRINSGLSSEEIFSKLKTPIIRNSSEYKRFFCWSLRQMPIVQIRPFLEYHRKHFSDNYKDFLIDIKYDKKWNGDFNGAIIEILQSYVEEMKPDENVEKYDFGEVRKGIIYLNDDVHWQQLALAIWNIKDKISLLKSKNTLEFRILNTIPVFNIDSHIRTIKNYLIKLKNKDEKLTKKKLLYKKLPEIILSLMYPDN